MGPKRVRPVKSQEEILSPGMFKIRNLLAEIRLVNSQMNASRGRATKKAFKEQLEKLHVELGEKQAETKAKHDRERTARHLRKMCMYSLVCIV
jgi:hypothetical protein